MSERFWINVRYAFNWKKPILFWRLMLSMFRIHVVNKDLLRYVDLSIGDACNMNCSHCFARRQESDGSKPDKRRIHPDYYGKIVKQAMDLGAVNFSFQGGEPLIYKDLRDYVKAARPHMNLISVTTNGLELSYSKARELKSWGVDIVTISIDDFRPLHANMAALDAVHNARMAGLKVTIGTVVSHSTLKGDLVKYLIKVAKRERIILMLIMACPEGALQDRPDEMLWPEDVRLIRQWEDDCPYIRTDFQANWKIWGCGAAKEIIYIKSNGETYCCPFIPISFGNVGRHSLKYIRERMLEIPALREYDKQCLAGEDQICKIL